MRYIPLLLLTSLGSCLLLGCVVSRNIEQQRYLLVAPKNFRQEVVVPHCSVVVEHALAVAPFDRLDFLYRVQSDRYLADYYHGFLVEPTEQLDVILGEALQNCSDSGTLVTQPRLQIKLVELYADYRDRHHPQGVIAIRFLLTQSSAGKSTVLLDQLYRSNIPLVKKDTDSLLQAWNEGLRIILRGGLKALSGKLRYGKNGKQEEQKNG